MDFHELEAFVTLARTLHFARAAATIHTSPSALSRLLTRLEEELGVRLLERDTRRVELTEQGQAFLTFAEDSLRRRDELHLFMNSVDGQIRGTLRIYASVTACYSILPPLVSELGRVAPNLRLSVDTGDPADAFDALRDGRVDIALAALPDAGFTGFDCFSVRRTPLVFAASRNGSWGTLDLEPDNAPPGSWNENSDRKLRAILSADPLILPQHGLARERMDRWLKQNRIRPHISAEVAGNEAILALARLGQGLGLVPRLVLENSPFAEGLVLYGAGPDFGDYDIGFVMGNSAHGIKKALRNMLVQVYPEGRWQ